jgi:predicted nucleotide-binding protein
MSTEEIEKDLVDCNGSLVDYNYFLTILNQPAREKQINATINKILKKGGVACLRVALSMAKDASTKYPDNHFFIGLQAEYLSKLHEFEKAIEVINAFLVNHDFNALDEKTQRVFAVCRSKAYEHLADMNQAMGCLDGVELKDNVVEQKIHLLFQNKDFVEVERLYLRFNPAKYETITEVAKSYFELGMKPKALAVLEPIIERSSEAKALYETYMQRGTAVGSKRKKVAVVHGRHNAGRQMFTFLRDIGLEPVEFSQAKMLAIKSRGTLHPHPFDILKELFSIVGTVIVVLTGDDEARILGKFWKESDGPIEKQLTEQPRPNVLFEGGLAYGYFPEHTIMVKKGYLRPFSDITGLHILDLDEPATKNMLCQQLHDIGMDVDVVGKTDWLNIKFE